MQKNPVSGTGIGLPAEALLELHDCIALALDAVSASLPCQRTMHEARVYLRDALRQIGGAA